MSWFAAGTVAVTTIGGAIANSQMNTSTSGTTTTGNSQHTNQNLMDYTSAYTRFAPWMFASLDPTAFLASGKGKNLGADFRANLQKMSDAEKQEAMDTESALARIRKRQETGQFLTPQETEFINTSLDKAFEYAHKTGYTDWEKGAQALAGRQGLRMSDTSVAKPAMEELKNFELGLGSQRAQLGLEATLGMSKQQNEFDAQFAQFNKMLAQQRMQTRQGFLFGGGMQGVAAGAYSDTEIGSSSGSQTGTMFDGINAGLNLGSRLGAMGVTAWGSTPAARSRWTANQGNLPAN